MSTYPGFLSTSKGINGAFSHPPLASQTIPNLTSNPLYSTNIQSFSNNTEQIHNSNHPSFIMTMGTTSSSSQMVQPPTQIQLNSGFVSQPLQMDKPPQLRYHNLWATEILLAEIDKLQEFSITLNSVIQSKANAMEEARQVSLKLWQFNSIKSTYKAMCPDYYPVQIEITGQVPQLVEGNSSRFEELLKEIGEINETSLFNSYFALTLQELQIAKQIHRRCALFLSSLQKGVDTPIAEDLKLILSYLSQKLKSISNGHGTQLLGVIRGWFYFIGYALDRASINENNSALQSKTPDIQNQISIPHFLLSCVLKSDSAFWACSLLHPSIDDILIHNWLSIAFDSAIMGQLKEPDIIKILNQVPWAMLMKLNPSATPFLQSSVVSMNPHQSQPSNLIFSSSEFAEQMKNSILLPLQSVLEYCSNNNYVCAVAFILKILAYVSRVHSATYSVTCLVLGLRAGTAAQLISLTTFAYYNWLDIDIQSLYLIFSEIYKMPLKKLSEYAQLSSSLRMEHRDLMIQFIFGTHPWTVSTYKLDQEITNVNVARNFPIFYIFAQIGSTYLKKSIDMPNLPFNLARLIIEELFYFASVWVPHTSMPNYSMIISGLNIFRTEIVDVIQRLCQESPYLYSVILQDVQTYSKIVSPDNLQSVHLDFDIVLKIVQANQLVLDDTVLDVFTYLLFNKHYDILPPENSPLFHSNLTALLSKPLGPIQGEKYVSFVLTILQHLDWSKVGPIQRGKAAMLVLACTQSGSYHIASVLLALRNILGISFISWGTTLTDILLPLLQEKASTSLCASALRLTIALDAVTSEIDPIQSQKFSKYSFSWLWDSFKLKEAFDQFMRILKQFIISPNPTHTRVIQTINTRNSINGHSTSKSGSELTIKSILPIVDAVFCHYANTIKYTDQHQRDISVYFNILISQLNTYSPNLGLDLLSNLYNRTISKMITSSRYEQDPTSQIERSTWMNFWVYALIPHISIKTNSSERLLQLLDTFSYTAFITQARFNEMCSLLPGGIPSISSEMIIELLKNRKPYLVYLLLHAYNPPKDIANYSMKQIDISSGTLPPNFKNTPLWMWYIDASSIGNSPILALIFWERFFWFYFEACAHMATTNLLPQPFKDMVNSAMFRSGSLQESPGSTLINLDPQNFESSTTIVNKLYYRLASWNKSVIFQNGANLFQPFLMAADSEDSPLLGYFQSQVPAPDALSRSLRESSNTADLQEQDPLSTNTFLPLPNPEGLDSICNLIPPPKPATHGFAISEISRYNRYLTDLYKTFDACKEATSQDSGIQLQNPEIFLVLDEFNACITQLENLETDIKACDTQYYNYSKSIWKKMETNTSTLLKCHLGYCEGANVSIKKVSPCHSSPTIMTDINNNRGEFQTLYNNYFSCIKTLANSAAQLEDICYLLKKEHQPIALLLFFKILPLAIRNLLNQAPLESIVNSLLILGHSVIQNQPTKHHMRFFKIVLENFEPTTHFIQRLPLLELFTPTCFIEGENYEVYLELLFILVSTKNNLRTEEFLTLLSQFNLIAYLPTLIGKYQDKMFSILKYAVAVPHLNEFVLACVPLILKESERSNQVLDLLSLEETKIPVESDTNVDTKLVCRLVSLLLSTSQLNPTLSAWHLIDSKYLSYDILNTIMEFIPTSNAFTLSNIVYFLRLLVNSKPPKSSSDGSNSDLDMLSQVMQRVFSTSCASPTLEKSNTSAFVAATELFCSLFSPNQMWKYYLAIITPWMAFNSEHSLTPILDAISGVKWNELDIGETDQDIVVQLNSLPFFHLFTVRKIFSCIDWKSYASHPKIPVKRMIHFLALFCKLTLLAPNHVNSEIRSLVCSVSTNPEKWYVPDKHLFDWREADPNDFPLAFRGNTLVAPLSHITVENRSMRPDFDFSTNIQLLFNIARISGHPLALQTVLEELKCCVAIAVNSSQLDQSKSQGLWTMPLEFNYEIIKNYSMPLLQQFHQSYIQNIQPTSDGSPVKLYQLPEYKRTFSEFLQAFQRLLRATNTTTKLQSKWDILPGTIPFSTDIRKTTNSEQAHIAEKAIGIVTRSFSTMDSDFALAVFNNIWALFGNFSVSLFTSTLRMYLMQFEFKGKLQYLIEAMDISEIFGNLINSGNTETNGISALSSRLIIDYYIATNWSTLSSFEYSNEISSIYNMFTRYARPNEDNIKFSYEILLHMFVTIEFVTSSKFTLTPRAVDTLKIILKRWADLVTSHPFFSINSLPWNIEDLNSPYLIPLTLAIKACYIFLLREIQTRDPNFEGDIQEALSDLEKQRSVQSNQAYNEFFSTVVSILNSPVNDVINFENNLIMTLFPFATYMLSWTIDNH